MTGIPARWPKGAALLVGLLCALMGPTRAAELMAELSERLVTISSGFTGTDILVFGAILSASRDHEAPQIAVVVRGPPLPVTVRHKRRMLGIWINREAVTFPDAPAYYAVATTEELTRLAEPAELVRAEIGALHLDLVPAPDTTEGNLEAFRAALVRAKIRQGLYRREEGGVRVSGNTLFRAKLRLPANVPVGIYRVTVHLMQEGRVVDEAASQIYITKVGIERRIFSFARREPLAYGVLAVLLAATAGWLGATLFRPR